LKFDEVNIGEVFNSSSYTISKEEIVEFALQFDPQYMHVDEEKANQSIFKGIIASGVHTLSLSIKLWNEISVWGTDVIAGTGMNNLEYTKPVYPGDDLYVMAEVIKKRGKRKSGEVTILLTTYKNDGIQVLKAEMSVLLVK
jgi:acyl dehydratase